jgi:hypothetical protein
VSVVGDSGLMALIAGASIGSLQIGFSWYLYRCLPVSVGKRDGRLVIRVGREQVQGFW